ncbi:glycosyltransferase [Salsipaludibacter albus]|uniref:glycosyltransferase n=1 Tax=Salsipaludibacter albus TaxID=2849650 RepID=UPI001EE4742F|nr:glycosyltransferase [Salsipaludibacter albus]MBY5161338.1 glycosyltransferase family 1 protein [Salsipaludibacter albus]
MTARPMHTQRGSAAVRVDDAPTGQAHAGTRPPLRVACVPATHRYVRALRHPGVVQVTDPSGDDHRTPLFLDPAWLREHTGSFDVLHVHFGFEYYAVEQLEAVCDVLDTAAIPLVYTCHDLRNPNHPTPELHDAGLETLLRRAAAVITLTPWAAEQILDLHARSATVLPHPHVVPLEVMARRTRVVHRDAVVGLHLKSLRANMRPHEALDGLLAAVGDGIRGRVDVHCDVLDPASQNHDAALVERLLALVSRADSRIELHVHHYFGEDELWAYLAQVDVFVLPYAFGTHSGLLEACRDLGTAVVAPDVGGYRDQGAHQLFPASEDAGLDVGGLAAAIRRAVVAGRPAPVPVEVRREQRRWVADAHHRLYRAALGHH